MIRLLPAARKGQPEVALAWRPRPPRQPGVSRCSMQSARLAPAPAPEGRYLGAPAPRSLQAEIRASLQLPAPTSASALEREGAGSAGSGPSCSGRRQPEWQRRACARRSAATRAERAPSPLPEPAVSLPTGTPTSGCSRRHPGVRVGRGPWYHLVWGGSGMRRASVPFSTPWGIPVTPISRVLSLDLLPEMTPPLLSGRSSTCP